MSFRLASLAVAAVAMAQFACGTGDEALVALIQLEPGVQATCISLTVSEPGTVPPRVLSETHVSRAAGRDEYRMAVYRANLPAEVILTAHALSGSGSGCAAPLVHVSSSFPAQRRFAGGAPAQVELTIPALAPYPDALAFSQMGPVISAGECASGAVRTTLDGGAAPVPADTAISFSVSPAGGLTTHTDGTCAEAASGAILPAGSSALPFQVYALAAGQYTLTASAAGLDSGTIVLDVQLSSNTAIAFGSAPWTGLRGACLGPVTVRPVDGTGNPSPLPGDATVSLSTTAPGVTFATDAQCANTTGSVVLPAGVPEVGFYFRSSSAGEISIRASAGALGLAVQAQQIVPNARTGSCTLGAGTAAIACPVPPPPVFDLSRAFLVVQAISNDNNPEGVNVRCRLADAGAIDCSRGGTTGQVDVAWHLVELPSGIRVQRANNSQCPNNLITVQPFDPAKTFVLFTAESPGFTLDENDYRTVRLVGNDQVEVLNNSGCGNATMDVQVIELEGASVERGVLDAGATPVTITTSSSADLGRSFLLHSARFDVPGPLCPYQVRGRLSSGNTITFTRGDGNAACQTPAITAIAWERVQLPPGATSQQVAVSMANGQSSASATISPVDPARSFAFSSSQLNAGAAFGETSFNGDDLPGVAGARHGLSSGSRLELTRAVDAGTARWTSYVVELP